MSSVRPSIRPSVTLVGQDHIGWKSWKLNAQTISPTPSLFVAQRPSTYSQGNREILGRRGGTWGGKKRQYLRNRKSYYGWPIGVPTLFRTVPSPTTTASSSQDWGFAVPKSSIAIISGRGKATDFKFGWYTHRVHPNKSPLKILEKRKKGA